MVFFYRFSEAPDLAVTNWNQSHGNHVFRNTTAGGISGTLKPTMAARIEAWPNPAVGPMKIAALCGATTADRTMMIYDMAGRVRRALVGGNGAWTWDGRDESGVLVEPGVYFAALGSASPRLKLIRVSHN